MLCCNQWRFQELTFQLQCFWEWFPFVPGVQTRTTYPLWNRAHIQIYFMLKKKRNYVVDIKLSFQGSWKIRAKQILVCSFRCFFPPLWTDTLALFILLGNVSELIARLKIWTKHGQIMSITYFTGVIWILSISVALLLMQWSFIYLGTICGLKKFRFPNISFKYVRHVCGRCMADCCWCIIFAKMF